MELFALAITVLAGILTYQAWKNGRWMKQAHEETQLLIREMRRETDETLKGISQTQKEIAYLVQKTQELIVVEGERTRQAIGSNKN